MKWLHSSLISAFWMAVRLDFRECLSKYSIFGRNILNLCAGIEAEDSTIQSRNLECHRCDIYHAKLGTCGIPGDVFLDPQTGKIQSFGCWCHVESANRIEAKDCWARANGLDLGWPDAIRPRHQK